MKRPNRKNRKFELEFRLSLFKANFWNCCSSASEEAPFYPALRLARLAKFSQTTLEHIEQGKANPLLGSMETLAEALGHRLSYIFRLAQDMEEST